MKNKKTFIITIILVIIAIGGYLLYVNFLNPKEKYALTKYIDTDVILTKYTKGKERNGILYIYDYTQDYFRIYNKNREDITPLKIKNSKISGANDITYNNTFLGYIVRTENEEFYYINNKGEIILESKTHLINLDNYIKQDSQKVCYTNKYNGEEYTYYCTKIYDLNGTLLIDGTKENYYISNLIYNKNNDTLFEVVKNDKVGLIDKNGNLIIDFKYQSYDFIENKNVILAKKDKQIHHLYDVTGKLLKEINLNDIKIIQENEYSGATDLGDHIYYYLNNTLYLINNEYELQKYDNIYYDLKVAEDFYKQYYITNNIYIRNINNTYTVHSLDGKQIISEEFKFVGPVNEDRTGEIGVPNGYITLCKNENRTNCGAIDFKGNILIDFENELYNYKEEYSEDEKILYAKSFYGFKNDNEYFDIQEGKVTKKLNCKNMGDITVNTYFDNTIYVTHNDIDFDNGGNQIIDYNCNELSKAHYYNIYKYDNFVVAQNKDWFTYDIYDINGIIIDYENKGSGKTTNLLGYNEGKLYFGNNKQIYILEESK